MTLDREEVSRSILAKEGWLVSINREDKGTMSKGWQTLPPRECIQPIGYIQT